MRYWKKKSKNGASKASKLPKLDGRTAKSEFEVKLYQDCRDVFEGSVLYESEKLHYILEYDYIPDILLTFKSGKKRYIEAKGNGRAFDASVQKKMIAVKEQHPDADIRIVFYKDGKVGVKRKDGTFRTQSEWAEKHGFLYSIDSIPKEWFYE